MDRRTIKLFQKICKKALKPIPKLTVSEWADKYRMLSAEASAEAGRWRTDRAPYQRDIMNAFTSDGVYKVIVKSASQVGKALDVNTPILTTKGFKLMGELTTSDMVYTENGKPCKVVAVSEVWKNRPCYEVTFTDNSKIYADENHLWTVSRQLKSGRKQVTETKATKDLLDYKYGQRYPYSIPVTKPLKGNRRKKLLMPPYALGYWLGDGNSCSAQLTVHKDDLEILDYLAEGKIYSDKVRMNGNVYVIQLRTELEHSGYFDTHCQRGHDFNVTGRTKKGYCAECCRQISLHNKWKGIKDIKVDPVKVKKDTIRARLVTLGVLDDKHIPEEYFQANTSQRLELLQGLMDSDGYVSSKGHCEITLKSEKLIKGVSRLLNSLGIKHTTSPKMATTNYKGRRVEVLVYRISFTTYSTLNVFRLKRKADKVKQPIGAAVNEVYKRRIKCVRPVEPRDTICIQVDNPTHLFLAGESLIPTHNSDIMNNIIGRFAHLDPAPILMIQPTIEMAQDFSKSRIAPMIRDTKVLNEIFTDTKTRETGNTILSKIFPGGRLAMGGANSPAGLASRPIRILLADEVDRFPASAGGEGDPVDLASKRMTTFWNRVQGLFSTPTIKGESRIEDEYLNGTQEEWQHKCPNCGEYHLISHRNIYTEHEENTDAKGIKHVLVTKVLWRCPDCGFEFTESEMKSAKQKYIAQNPPALEKGVRSFFVNCFASPWLNWEQVMQEWLEAKGDPEREKVVFNTRFGEAYEQAGAFESTDQFLNRREDYGAELPEGVLILTAAVDTQDNRLEYEISGWGHGEQCWKIKKGTIYGIPDNPEVWEKLDQVLDRAYELPNGRALTVARTFIDSGGHYTQNVYEYCYNKRHLQRIAIKGSHISGAPFLPRDISKAVAKNYGVAIPLLLIGVSCGKQYIMDRLSIKVPGAKYIHFPIDVGENGTADEILWNRGFDELYFKGLISEKKVARVDKGRIVYEWKNIAKDKRNEPLDLSVYNLACLHSIKPNFDELEIYQRQTGSAPPIARTRTKKMTSGRIGGNRAGRIGRVGGEDL